MKKLLKKTIMICGIKTNFFFKKIYFKKIVKFIHMKILILGGAGYVGSKLVPKLLELHHKITVLDLMLYGQDVLADNENLIKVKGDIEIKNF